MPIIERRLSQQGMNTDTMRNTFFFSAKTQFENLGDAVISRELLKLLSHHGQVMVSTSGVPVEFQRKVAVQDHTQFPNRWRYVAALFKAVVCCWLSGGRSRVFYVLNPGGFSGGVRTKDIPRQLALVAAYALLNMAGVRLMRLGASFGPFQGARVGLEKLKYRFIEQPTVRDSLSQQYAHSLGLDRVSFFPDLAFQLGGMNALEPRRRGSCSAALNEVIVSFRQPKRFRDPQEFVEALHTACAQPLLQLKGVRYLFLSQVDFDRQWNQSLAHGLAVQGIDARYVDGGDESTLLQHYRRADLVVSNRLHVLLFTLSQGTAVLAVTDGSGDAKISGILGDLGLGNAVVDLGQPRAPGTLSVPPDVDAALARFADHRKLGQDRLAQMMGSA